MLLNRNNDKTTLDSLLHLLDKPTPKRAPSSQALEDDTQERPIVDPGAPFEPELMKLDEPSFMIVTKPKIEKGQKPKTGRQITYHGDVKVDVPKGVHRRKRRMRMQDVADRAALLYQRAADRAVLAYTVLVEQQQPGGACEKVTAKDKAICLTCKAAALMRASRAAEAVACLRKAQQIDPEYVKASFYLGHALRVCATAVSQKPALPVDEEDNAGYFESHDAKSARLKQQEELERSAKERQEEQDLIFLQEIQRLVEGTAAASTQKERQQYWKELYEQRRFRHMREGLRNSEMEDQAVAAFGEVVHMVPMLWQEYIDDLVGRVEGRRKEKEEEQHRLRQERAAGITVFYRDLSGFSSRERKAARALQTAWRQRRAARGATWEQSEWETTWYEQWTETEEGEAVSYWVNGSTGEAVWEMPEVQRIRQAASLLQKRTRGFLARSRARVLLKQKQKLVAQSYDSKQAAQEKDTKQKLLSRAKSDMEEMSEISATCATAFSSVDSSVSLDPVHWWRIVPDLSSYNVGGEFGSGDDEVEDGGKGYWFNALTGDTSWDMPPHLHRVYAAKLNRKKKGKPKPSLLEKDKKQKLSSQGHGLVDILTFTAHEAMELALQQGPAGERAITKIANMCLCPTLHGRLLRRDAQRKRERDRNTADKTKQDEWTLLDVLVKAISRVEEEEKAAAESTLAATLGEVNEGAHVPAETKQQSSCSSPYRSPPSVVMMQLRALEALVHLANVERSAQVLIGNGTLLPLLVEVAASDTSSVPLNSSSASAVTTAASKAEDSTSPEKLQGHMVRLQAPRLAHIALLRMDSQRRRFEEAIRKMGIL